MTAGCVTVPVPKMEQQEASGIAISVKIKPPIGWPSKDADKVYFAKLDSRGDIQQSEVIPSNYGKDGRIYLLNVTPGDYVAVVAWNKGAAPAPMQPGLSVTFNPGRIVFFPKDLVELTRVSVGKGQVACVGSYVLSTSVFGDRDLVQSHYENVMNLKWSLNVGWRGTLHEAKNDDNTKGECLRMAKEDLAEGGWTVTIK